MNQLVSMWIYILLVISFVYWFTIVSTYAFPTTNPIIFSLIGAIIIYYLSNQQTLILLV